MNDIRAVSRELRRANRALRMLSDATRTLGGATNEADLLREICRIVVDVGGYRMAWVGFARQDDTKSIHPAAYAGFDAGYLESLHLTWADRDRGRGPVGTAIRTGQTCTIRDIQDSTVLTPPMREEASQRGYHAIIALPLLADGRAYGVLAIYADEADAFDAGEVEILTELAGALAVGESGLRARIARERAESHLQLIRQLIDQSNDGILVVDPPTGRVLDTNDTALRRLGYSRDEFLALSVADFDVYMADPSRWASHLTSLRTAGALTVESVHRRKDGTVFPVEVGVRYVVDDQREYLIAVARDATERKGAEAEIRKLNRLYRVLSQVNQAIVRTHDYQELLDEACRTVVVEGQFDVTVICCLDAQSGDCRVVASHGAGPDGQRDPDCPRIGAVLATDGLEMRAIRDGRIIFGDAHTESSCGVAVPLRVADRVWGAITFGSLNPECFDAQEVQLIEELAGDLGYAIESVQSDVQRRRAEAALQERERHAQSLLRLSRQFESAGTYDHVLAAARQEVHEILGYQNLWVYLLNPDRTQAIVLAARGAVARAVMFEEGVATLSIPGDRMLEEIAEARDIVVIEDARTDPRTNKGIVARVGNRTIVNVPIIFFDKHLGSMGTGSFGDEGVRAPTESERQYLRAMASHMAVSLDRLHLLEARERAEQERAAHVRLLESLDQINRAIQRTNDFEQMMRDALDAVVTVLGCDRAFLLYPCDPDAAAWRIPMERTRPEYPGAQRMGRAVPMDGEVAWTLRTLLDADGPVTFCPGGDHRLPAGVAEGFGFRSYMGMVVYPKVGKPWQFGLHQCSEARLWTPDDRKLFQEIGRRLADGLTGFLTSRDSQESEGRYRRITEGLTDFHYSVRVDDGRAVESTHGAGCETVTGYVPEEFAADSDLWIRMIPEEDREAVWSRVRQVLAGDDVPPFEHRIVRKDGALRWVSDTTISRRDSAGRLVSYDGVVRDITALKLAEESLRKLSRAVEQSPVSIVVTDRAGNIEYVNPKFTEVSGYAQEAVLGRNPRLLKSGEMPPEQYAQMWKTITSGGEWHGEFHNRKKSGELHWERASISPIFDAGGVITHFVAVKEDITARKRLEEELRQAQKMDAFGQLAGGVAHDFNNLLTVIQGNVSLALDSLPGSQEQVAALDDVVRAVARATDLTRQLLMFSRRQAVRLTDLDLNEVVGNMTKMLQRLIGEHISLVARYAAGGAPVHADAGMLEQVLMNLAVNSRDAMPKGGQLDIQTELVDIESDAATPDSRRRPGSFVRVSVSDSGSGIAPEVLPRIFEPFFTTKDVGKGTGLGLATVFGIVEQHHGWIEVNSRIGVGTSFHVYLPRLDAGAATAGTQRVRSDVARGTETILLVEDDATVRSLASRVLARKGYTVLEAPSGPEALRLWVVHHAAIDLLLTDMVMPDGISGRDLAARLQAGKPGLKVLFSSGYTNDIFDGDSSLRDGPNFIDKPYSAADLERKVRSCLDASH